VRGIALLLAVLLLAPGLGHSASFVVSGGGVDDAAACIDVGCGDPNDPTMTLTTLPEALVSGTISIDTGLLSLDLNLSAASLDLSTGGVVGGATDNGVSDILFSSVVYAATGLTLSDLGSGVYGLVGGQTASVSGDQTQVDNATTVQSSSFAAPSASISGQCFVNALGGTCGLTFGSGGFSLDVGPSGSTDPRFIRHTMNVTLVPEPSSSLLLGAGLAALALLRRRRP
jgi:hypothetical protein